MTEHDGFPGHDARRPQRDSPDQLPPASRTTALAYDPVHDPHNEAGYGLLGISQTHNVDPSGKSHASGDVQPQSLGADQLRQEDVYYDYDSATFSNAMQGHQSHQESNQGYLDILDPFNGFDIPFWFEQDQHWDVFQNFS